MIRLSCAFLLTASLCSCSTSLSVAHRWQSPKGLQVTESVYFDQASEHIYVSNINGKPTEMNMQGFITKLTLNGEVETLKWVTGMNAPKGMGVFHGKLYVSDINQVHIIDMQKGAITETIAVEGAKFLNDIAIDNTGTVYISDSGKSRITRLKNGQAETWLNLKQFKKPNGLLMQGADLLVGTAAGLLRVNLATKQAQLEIPLNGGIDGLKALGNGHYVVSDWKGKIQRISKDSKPVLLSDTTGTGVNAADFEYLPQADALLVPTFFDNRVTLLQL